MACFLVKFSCLIAFTVLLAAVGMETQTIGSHCTSNYNCSKVIPNSFCDNGFCYCRPTYQPVNTTACTKILGQNCYNATDCKVPNSFCTGYPLYVCACNSGFVQFNNSMCGRGVGSPCTPFLKCDAPNSYCRGGSCACQDNYVPDSNHTRCNWLSTQKCNAETCRHVGQNGYCDQSTGQCLCYNGAIMHNNFCYQVVDQLGASCDKHSQICSLRRTFTRGVECNDKKCKCKNGFKPSKDKFACNSAITISATLSTVILALISRVMS